MILTGSEIINEWRAGRIVIDPFDLNSVNPNSYNFHLSNTLLQYEGDVLDAGRENPTRQFLIGEAGIILSPGCLYLASTIERLGGMHYVPTFSARSSVARLGLFINLSACLGDIGYIGRWTLQLVPTVSIRIYSGMAIGQMMWWCPSGRVEPYQGKYQGSEGVTASKSFHDLQYINGIATVTAGVETDTHPHLAVPVEGFTQLGELCV